MSTHLEMNEHKRTNATRKEVYMVSSGVGKIQQKPCTLPDSLLNILIMPLFTGIYKSSLMRFQSKYMRNPTFGLCYAMREERENHSYNLHIASAQSDILVSLGSI